MNNFSLKGMVGIVTGGSSGIGLSICKRLANSGAKVYALSRRGIAQDGSTPIENLIHKKIDITDDKALESVISKIASECNNIDFLINNAGMSIKKRAEELSLEEFNSVMNLNVNAMFNASKLCYRYLKNSKFKGRIINISSMAAHLGFQLVVPYCASKAAVLGLTRGLALDWAQENICVNSIAPGWFPSELGQKVLDPERKQRILNRIPLGYFGDTDDLAAMCQFLLSSNAKYITGIDYAVDGGALAYGV